MTRLSKDKFSSRQRRPSRRRRTLDAVVSTLTANDDRALNRARADLRRVDPQFDTAVARMMDARPGLPGAASYDGPVSGGSKSSSTERFALQGEPDDAKQRKPKAKDVTADIGTLDAALRRLLADCTRLATGDTDTKTTGRITSDTATVWRLVLAWTPRPPTSRQRAEVERSQAGAPECSYTRDVLNIHEPAYRTTDLGGLLPEPQPVGRWVWERSKVLGRLPSPNEMRRWASRKDDARRQVIGAGR